MGNCFVSFSRVFSEIKGDYEKDIEEIRRDISMREQKITKLECQRIALLDTIKPGKATPADRANLIKLVASKRRIAAELKNLQNEESASSSQLSQLSAGERNVKRAKRAKKVKKAVVEVMGDPAETINAFREQSEMFEQVATMNGMANDANFTVSDDVDLDLDESPEDEVDAMLLGRVVNSMPDVPSRYRGDDGGDLPLRNEHLLKHIAETPPPIGLPNQSGDSDPDDDDDDGVKSTAGHISLSSLRHKRKDIATSKLLDPDNLS